MKHRLFQAALLVCLTTGLLAGLCFAQPNVGLTGVSGPPTSKLPVSGSGFAANAAIDIFFDTTDLALTVSNSTGSFSFIQIRVPASALPGKHWITAVARSNRHCGAEDVYCANQLARGRLHAQRQAL